MTGRADLVPDPRAATLLVVDVQERLMAVMPDADLAQLVKATQALVATFRHFGGRVVFTEQYPAGLGPTVGALAGALEGADRLEKVEFSVAACPAFGALSPPLSGDVVLCGAETHVCVLATGLDLLAAGHRVFVPIDAVVSRHPRHRDNGLRLLAEAGARLVNAETILFLALGAAGTDEFRRLSRLVR